MPDIMLRIDGVPVDLPENFTITVEYLNSIFNPDKFKGTFSYPISLPAKGSKVNQMIFGHPEKLQSAGTIRRTYAAELEAHGHLVVKGSFKIRKPTPDSYPGYLVGDVGAFSDELAGALLNGLDLGSQPVPVVQVSTGLLFATAPERLDDAPYTEDDPVTQEVTTFHFRHYKPDGSVQFEFVKFAGNLESTLKNLAGYINASETLPYTALATGGTLSVVTNTALASMPDLKIAVFYRKASGALELAELVVPFERLMVNSPGNFAAGTTGNGAAQGFVFPMVHNPDFFGPENTQWNGYVNFYQNNGYPANNERLRTKYSLVPMLFLRFVLDKLWQVTGYTASGAFLDDAQFASLVVYNTRSLDEQPAGYAGEPFGQVADTITFADHLPEQSVESWLNELRSLFGLDYEIDVTARRITFHYLKDILAGQCRDDWTPYAVRKWSRDQEDLKGVTYGFAADSTDELFKADQDKQLHPQYAPYVLRDGKDRREAKISSLLTEAVAPYVVPRARQRGISPLFKQSGNRFAGRLLFWHGLRPDSTGQNYPKASNTSPDGSITLQWNGASGLFERFWKDWQGFQDNTRRVEMPFTLNIAQVANLRLREKKYVAGQQYLVEKIQVTFPLRESDPAKAVMWQV